MASTDPERQNDGALPRWVQDTEGIPVNTPARSFADPAADGKTILHFHVTTRLDRADALELRDTIVDTLATALGIRLSLTDDGTDIYLSAGVPTLGDVVTGESGPERQYPPAVRGDSYLPMPPRVEVYGRAHNREPGVRCWCHVTHEPAVGGFGPHGDDDHPGDQAAADQAAIEEGRL